MDTNSHQAVNAWIWSRTASCRSAVTVRERPRVRVCRTPSSAPTTHSGADGRNSGRRLVAAASTPLHHRRLETLTYRQRGWLHGTLRHQTRNQRFGKAAHRVGSDTARLYIWYMPVRLLSPKQDTPYCWNWPGPPRFQSLRGRRSPSSHSLI